MHDFILREIINTDIVKELECIGFDKSYINNACQKFEYKNFKIFDLTVAQANIIKQTALSVGADCATHRSVVTGDAELTDCILGGSISQLTKIAQKLLQQPFGLKELGEILINKVSGKHCPKTKIAGILNLTKDSFSDGGEFYEYDDAILHIDELISDGADIIDIGAESTKPGAKPVTADKQLEKLIPVIKYAKGKNVAISIDTRSSKVAEECLKLGADIINDVSGFDYDAGMPEVIAKYGAKVIIQHSKGLPENMQNNPEYSNLMDEIYLGLKAKIEKAESCGIVRENIIIDPGIGFGKTREHNFEIISRIEELYSLGCPVMVGVSRKSLLNMPQEDNETKDVYSMAINAVLINKKVDYIRVHNVKLHKKLTDMLNI